MSDHQHAGSSTDMQCVLEMTVWLFTCESRCARKSRETRWELRMVRTDGLSFGFILNICLTKNWSSYGRCPGRGGYAPRHIFKIRLFQLGAWNWTHHLQMIKKNMIQWHCYVKVRWRENIPGDAGCKARTGRSRGTTHRCRTHKRWLIRHSITDDEQPLMTTPL